MPMTDTRPKNRPGPPGRPFRMVGRTGPARRVVRRRRKFGAAGPPRPPPSPGQRRLRGGEAGDRHAVGRAGDVVEAELVAELDRVRIAAVFAADAELDVRAGAAALARRRSPSAGRRRSVSSVANGFFLKISFSV